jgi:peptide/nickel transport system permease protein
MTDLVSAISSEALPERRRFVLVRRLAAHRSFAIGFVIVVLLVALTLLAPILTSGDPSAMSIRQRFRPPSTMHLFGTDMYGRDIFTRVLYGARLSLWIGTAVAIISGVLGALIGLLAGYFRAADAVLMRIMDALMAFPAILLAIGITATLGPQTSSVIAALSAAYLPRTARVVRAAALVIREQEFVEAARISGAGAGRIILRHLLPNSVGPLLVQLTFVFAYAILAEAALSFVGVGPPPPTPSWGNIIAEGRDYSIEAWWIMLFPGMAICIATLGVNLIGDGLRDILDPRLKIEG